MDLEKEAREFDGTNGRLIALKPLSISGNSVPHLGEVDFKVITLDMARQLIRTRLVRFEKTEKVKVDELQCPTCGTKSKSKAGLAAHMRSHRRG